MTLDPSKRSAPVSVATVLALRKQLGLSPAMVAEKTGLSCKTISNLEHGLNVDLRTIGLVAEALGVEPPEIMDGVGNAPDERPSEVLGKQWALQAIFDHDPKNVEDRRFLNNFSSLKFGKLL
jgi:transcriptional regulator with XRE-family HTH domain